MKPSIVKFSRATLLRKRGAAYLAEMEEIAVNPKPGDVMLSFDERSEAYLAMVRKYCASSATQVEDRPSPTIKQAASFARAILTGKYVSDEIRQQREAVCARCDQQKLDSGGVPWCGVCGCGTSNAEKKIRNLAAFEETLNWGCKHPERKQGKGWPLTVLPNSE